MTDSDNLCLYPFMQLLLQPTGVVSPCCWNQEVILGKVTEKSLDEIWNDEPARKLRREFLEGNPVSCAQQIRHIGCHLWSRRSYAKEIPLTEIQPHGPRRLDVRLNGRCNLQCVMCDVWSQPNGIYDDSDFWTRGPSEIFPYLREIDVLGGEPFIQGDTYKLIDGISAVNPACTWAFVTNGHYKFADAIRSRLEKIEIRWLQVSLDSVNPKTYAKIRVNGELSRTLETIEEYQSYQKEREEQGRGFKFVVSMCVQQANWSEIGSFLSYAGERSIEPILQFAFQPDNASLLNLEPKQRRFVLNQVLSLVPVFGEDALQRVLGPLRDSLPEPIRAVEAGDCARHE